MAYDERMLVGVRGWLAFFVITLAVFGPLRSLVSIFRDMYADPQIAAFYGDRWPALQAMQWALLVVSVAGSEYLAWRLVARQEPSTPRVVIAGLWVLAILPSTLDAIGISLLAGAPFGRVFAGLGAASVQPLFYSAIWTAYLLRSERVANTYTSDAPDELAAVFG